MKDAAIESIFIGIALGLVLACETFISNTYAMGDLLQLYLFVK